MDHEQTFAWTGAGRWLMIVLGLLLIAFAVPLIFSRSHGAGAGWDIFLGLLAIGGIASGHPKAPLLAIILSALMMIRLAASVVMGASGWSICVSLAFAGIASMAAYYLRRQAMAT